MRAFWRSFAALPMPRQPTPPFARASSSLPDPAARGIAVAAIAMDIALKSKRLDTITSVYFGLIVGLFLTYIVQLGLGTFLALIEPDIEGLLHKTVPLVIGMVLCYICISLLLQTRND